MNVLADFSFTLPVPGFYQMLMIACVGLIVLAGGIFLIVKKVK